MSGETFVIDANIAVKMLHAEPDTDQARLFFRACAGLGLRLLVPELFLYEVVNVCQRVGVGIDDVLGFYETLRASVLTVVEPGRDVWLKAASMARQGHPNSGFPSIYDAIYHALALDAGGTFLTADKRHVAKTRQHGAVMLLSEWREDTAR